MNLVSIYEKIKNPIEDDNVVNTLINMYMQSLEKSNFYDVLVSKKEDEDLSKNDIDAFYCLMFEEWKNSIIGMSFKQFSSLVKNETYKKNFSKMREFLQKLPSVKTKEDVDNIIYKNYKGKDSEISEMLQTYYWIKSENSEWEYVYYNYITLKRDPNSNLENLFIMNVDKSIIYKLASLIVTKCKDYDMPYYFKFNKIGNRIDSMVIGIDSQYLVNYLRIFDEIKRKNPELVSKLNKAPILTGRLSSWLGYGANLSKQRDLDFYETRTIAIKEAIENCISSYILSNKDNIQLQEKVLENIIKIIEDEGNKEKLEDFGIDEINEVFLETVPEFLQEFCDNSNKSFDIENTDNGDCISISKENLENSIKRAGLEFMQESENTIEDVRNKIKSLSSKYKIDSEKFCFDENMIEK